MVPQCLGNYVASLVARAGFRHACGHGYYSLTRSLSWCLQVKHDLLKKSRPGIVFLARGKEPPAWDCNFSLISSLTCSVTLHSYSHVNILIFPSKLSKSRSGNHSSIQDNGYHTSGKSSHRNPLIVLLGQNAGQDNYSGNSFPPGGQTVMLTAYFTVTEKVYIAT